LLAVAFAARASQAEPGQLDSSPTLFTVMAALNAAGLDAGLDAPSSHPLRKDIRAELAKRDVPSLAAIRQFVATHHAADPAAELTQYVSFALSVGPPPNFAPRGRDVDLPPEVARIREFSKLLVPFYKEAGIAELWQRSQPAIDDYIARYHGPVTQAVLQVNAYLRQQTSGYQGRHFQIFIELLAPPGQVHRRSYGYEDTVVVTPSAEPRWFDVRHAYLHYLLDPMATRYQEILERKKFLTRQAQRVRRLSDSFQDDFFSLTTESLIKAIESRLDRDPAAIERALYQGFILAPYFSEALLLYEKQEQSMLVYYPEMMGAIDANTPDRRRTRPSRWPTPRPPRPPCRRPERPGRSTRATSCTPTATRTPLISRRRNRSTWKFSDRPRTRCFTPTPTMAWPASRRSATTPRRPTGCFAKRSISGRGPLPRPGCWSIWASSRWRPRKPTRRNSFFLTPCKWMAYPTWPASRPRLA
jgi:hypothetical protein